PEDHASNGITDENRIVRQVDQPGLQADLLDLLSAFAFGALLFAHITNGTDSKWLVAQQHGAQADIHRELDAILAPPKQLKSGSHRAHTWRGEIVLPVSDVDRA